MMKVKEFQETLADFYGSKYAVATDCCTHAIELCLRVVKPQWVSLPKRTYVSVPMTMMKLSIPWQWTDQHWQDYYNIGNTNIIDAAVYWQRDGYIKDTLMCLSFQFKKHLSLGRGGMILTDSLDLYQTFTELSYDGRKPDQPWAEQNIQRLGYHYYMTPETAELGLARFDQACQATAKIWSASDYPDLSKMGVFNAE